MLSRILAYMGTSDITTVYVAELQGIKLALLIASDDQEAGRKRDKIVIYTDNQAAIKTTGTPTGKSGAYIMADIVYLIGKIQGEWRTRIEVRWIPAHTGVPGNKLADTAAKEAAGWSARGQGNQTIGNTVLAKTYPLQAILKTWIKQEAKMEWDHSWKTEKRKGKLQTHARTDT